MQAFAKHACSHGACIYKDGTHAHMHHGHTNIWKTCMNQCVNVFAPPGLHHDVHRSNGKEQNGLLGMCCTLLKINVEQVV